ncbi:site-2 protease family protein [Candidatus Finniella inopinata]|uniref:Site-2 protease family protein n=1 Tax=Candidatus Finniella inopinata TaxID=1696036 RepID=A0A4Q7DIX5_9PROT|nr:site-2 protease family protein [Candidatus Finniella inopinata]RZI46075.1 site-2 protease family protein [Candidatus Finniella inopinata]
MTLSYFIATLASLIALAFAITSYAAVRGIVAGKFGDTTAKAEHRNTFNPLVHIDPLGTFILPGLLLLMQAPFIMGWPKPLPINFNRLHPHKLGTVVVTLSGLFVHLFIAWTSVMLIHLNPTADTLGNEILINSFRINLMFMVFSLLPLPPLDGGRLIASALPPAWAESYLKVEPYTPMIILLMLFLPSALATIGIHFNPLLMILMPLLKALQIGVLFLSGHL